MKKVICKMECVKADGEGDHFGAELRAVADGSKENEDFFSATPYGELKLGVVAKQHFEVGKSYYVTLEQAD